MKNQISKVVAGTVPGVLGGIAPELLQAVGPISSAVMQCTCKEELAAIEIARIVGPAAVQYCAEVTNKLIECWEIAEKSECKNTEFIIQAVFSDTAATLEEKVRYVKEFEDARTENKVKITNARGKHVLGVVGAVCATVTVNNLIDFGKKVVPVAIKGTKEVVKSKTFWGTVKSMFIK